MIAGLDRAVLAELARLRSSGLDAFFLTVTQAGEIRFLLPLVLVVLASLLLARELRRALFWVAATCGASLLNPVLKGVVARPRPHLFPTVGTLPASFSFPSGHAMQITAFVVAGLVLLRGSRLVAGRWSWWVGGGVVLISTVCLSRPYLQVHYVSDVLAGGVIALLWVLGLARLLLPAGKIDGAAPGATGADHAQ